MDNLRGSETFGDPEDNDSAWATPFERLEFSKVKIESLDRSYSVEFGDGGRRIINRLSQHEYFSRWDYNND